MKSTRYEGRTAIVTGAGSGIGQATVVRLVGEGARVIGCDLNADGLAVTRDRLGDLAPGATLLTGDITVQEFVDVVVRAADGKVDLLANVAGIMDHFVPLGELDDEMWERVLDVNLTSVMRMTRGVLPGMVEAGSGCVVTVASKASISAGASGVSYAASKHGVIGLVKHVAYFYGPKGVRSNAVLPGPVETGIGASSMPTSPWAIERAGLSMATMPAMAAPEQIASAISWLGCDESSNVNGAILTSDGGWSTA
jgi:NAD(P)-dependent dehydrogenase (short-subunit alcohol dehydrogenase family)